MGFPNPWTPQEIVYLKDHYASDGTVGVANAIGRNPNAVRNKAYKLLITQPPQLWTAADDDALRRLYAKYTEALFLDDVAQELGRTRGAVARRASQLGITSSKRPKNPRAVGKQRRSPGSYEAARNAHGRICGGYCADIGIYVRSGWEANYARYLNWMQEKEEILGWAYEPDTFEFPEIQREVRFYTPDFRVTKNNGTTEYHEIKGYLAPKGRAALDAMAKHYPNIEIVLVDAATYKSIRKQVGRFVPGWEGLSVPSGRLWTPECERELRNMWESGVHASIIANALGHSEDGVCVRAQRLGLRRPEGKRAKRLGGP